MGKTDFIRVIALRTGMTDEAAREFVGAALTTIIEALQRGEPVTLPGFGRFEGHERSARTGRHPRSGETLSIPAATLPRFHAGKQLKEAVRS